MANVLWIGNARSIAQVDTLTVGGTIETDDIFIITINGKSLSTVGGSATAATVATTIATAFNLVTDPEFAEITAAATSGGALTLTADTAGKPFTATVSTTETGGGSADSQTFATAATTANVSPSAWADTDNWSTGAVPVSTDNVYLDGNSSILYGLAQSSVTLASLTVAQTFTGDIGLPERATTGYNEYRATYLAVSATSLVYGLGKGGGSGRAKIDVGSNQCALTVHGTGGAKDSGLPALLWKGTHASNTAVVRGGSVGIAALATESATLLTLTQDGGTIEMGDGMTVGDITKNAGTLLSVGATTTGSKTLILR